MWGCFASKQICRVSMPRSLAAALDTIVHKMNSWVGSLGAEVVKKVESLVCFRGVHPLTGRRRDIVALLLCRRAQPNIHFYAICDIKGASPEVVVDTMPEALQFIASIRVVHSRMSKHCDSIDIKTNEELAHEMALSQMEWRLVPLHWCLPEGASGTSPLLDHVVTMVADAFEPKAKVARRTAITADDFLDQLDSDPIAAGVSAALVAEAAGSGASPCLPRLFADGGRGMDAEAGVEAEAGMEAELFADVEEDVLDDFHQELFGELLPLDDMEDSPDDDDSFVDDDDAAEESAEEAGAAPEAEVDYEAAAARAAAARARAIDEAVAHCHVDADGTVTCALPPWNAMTAIGLISTWPKEREDMQRRNISCRCYMHMSCTSPAKVFRSVRQDTLLRWLLSGTPVYPVASNMQRNEWGAAHKPSWLGIFAQAPPPSPPPA